MLRGPDQQSTLSDDKHRGVIFSYFVGAIWFISLLATIQNIYLSLTLTGSVAEEYASYNASNIAVLIFFGLIWWGHRWHPRLIRHIFLIVLVFGALFFFELRDINGSFVILTLPIIMAAFLIQPIYSFVYYVLIFCVYVLRIYLEGLSITDEQLFPFISLIALIVFAIASWLIAQSLNTALAETRALNEELDQRVRDRTRELAEALARERATAVRNTTILESIADGVLVFDAKQRVMIANPAANQLAGRDLQLLTLREILATLEDKAGEVIKSWVKGQKPTDLNNVKFEWNSRIISANIAPVILSTATEERVDAGSVMVLRDFTKEAELEKAKTLFLGMVSHELRTPMSAIQGYVKVLMDTEKDNISANGYEYLQTITGSIKQLLTLANDLIDLSRMETGEIELYCQWVDLDSIINHAVKMVQQEFAVRNLELKVKLPDSLPQLYLDKNRILQVLLNLLSNAYKYTAQGGTTIEVTHSDKWVNIAVIDTGVGIKEADQVKLFSRFFRANDRFVQKVGGTGLGLSISKGFTELHGGQLTFESEYGVGTTFKIVLPKNGAALNQN